MQLQQTIGYRVISEWLAKKNFRAFAFQEETWQHIIDGKSGLVNAPTGFGKTFSVFLGAVIDFINQHPDNYQTLSSNKLQLIWVTPLRALAKDIGRAMEEVISELGMPWKVGIRNGDTAIKERQRQKKSPPDIMIITPESMHLLLAQKGYAGFFATLKIIAVDEWHELLGSKRGVQVELAISRLVALSQLYNRSLLQVWGISATIGNLEEARDVLLASLGKDKSAAIVKAVLKKNIAIESILPDEIEKYPWPGTLVLSLFRKYCPSLMKAAPRLFLLIQEE
ncbi:MAG: DEAD/DEAH box helicase [Agriterribacter sp.]